jgi:hypothetical protein
MAENYGKYRNVTFLDAAVNGKKPGHLQNPLSLNVDVGRTGECLARPPVYYPSDLLKQSHMTMGGVRPAPIFTGKECPPTRRFC